MSETTVVCDNSSSFDPSSLVESFHGIPHVDIDLNDSPTDFDTDQEYFEVGRYCVHHGSVGLRCYGMVKKRACTYALWQ